MKNNRTFTIVFFGILAIAILIFIFSSYSGFKKFLWVENYRAGSDEPYGTEFIKDMLKGHATGSFTYNTEKKLSDVLDTTKNQQTYVFIGNYMFLDSLSLSTLIRFVGNGNDAFVASGYPQEILYRLWTRECMDTVSYPNTRNNSISANFYHPDFAVKDPYTFTYQYEDGDLPYDWNYITSTAFCDSVKSVTPLGFIDPYYVNFFKIRYGKGNLFVHTNPIAFSNYSLTREKNVGYASSVFSHFSTRDLIWDEYSKRPAYDFGTGGRDTRKSPLYFVMGQPSLRYGWWLLVITAVLYIVFTAKRKQKVIPVLEPKTNTSLQFIKLISTLHYQHEDNNDMARKKMKHFLHHVRTKYGLSTHKIDETFTKRLSLKSSVSEEEINNIFSHYQVIERFKDITIARLVEFHQHVDNFYKKGK